MAVLTGLRLRITIRITEVAIMITLRLDPKLERSIDNTAKNLGLTKSELIRKSIHAFLGRLDEPSPWELGKNMFGKYSSGLGNLSTDRKMLLKDKIRAKRK
jgi:hypothetical protein